MVEWPTNIFNPRDHSPAPHRMLLPQLGQVLSLVAKKCPLNCVAWVLGLLLAACGPTGDSSPAPQSSVPPPIATMSPSVTFAVPTLALAPAKPSAVDALIHNFRNAQSITLVASPDGTLHLALGRENKLYVTRSTDGGRTFGPEVQASLETPVEVMPIVRPALAADERHVSLAWIQQLGPSDSKVWYTRSDDGGRSFAPSRLVATSDQFETTMVSLALDPHHNPVVAWLQAGAVRTARSTDAGASFTEPLVVDDQVCECCQPQLLMTPDRLFVAYRNLERDSRGRDTRDIFVASSDTGASLFNPGVRASDGHWYINACPISGPSLVGDATRLYAAWMDARDDGAAHGRSDVWLATSTDGGRTFSPNVRVSPTATHYHKLPALALGSRGRLHVVWETDEDRRQVLMYTTSDDGGKTFATPRVVVSSADGTSRGKPTLATVAVTQARRVHLAWVDSLGAHVATWDD